MFKRRAIPVMVGASLLALLLAACRSNGPTTVDVSLTEYKVMMSTTTVPAGPVVFNVTNGGSAVHELVLEKAGAVNAPLEAGGRTAEVEGIRPGLSMKLEWTLDTPGDYQLTCHRPGHFENGMVTRFTVTGT